MIIRILFTGYCVLLGFLAARSQVPAIGSWRDHLPYHQAIGIASTGELLWCATPYSLFSVDPSDNSMDRLSKTNGLSETGISAFVYDAASARLVIAYTNSNIDIVFKGHTVNIPDIKRTDLAGDKTIHQVFVYNNLAYLSSGLGVIVLDEEKYEVKDTWVIGDGGDTIAVQALTTDGTYFYAASSEGLKRAPLASPGLADYHNWVLLSGQHGLAAGPCRQVASVGGKVLALKNDSIFQLNGDEWSLLYADGWTINDCSVSDGRLLVSEQQGDSGRVRVLSGLGVLQQSLQQADALHSPRQTLIFQGRIWVADAIGGLSAWELTGNAAPARYAPNSPLSLATGDMVVGRARDPAATGGVLWVASGGVDAYWAPLNNHNGLSRLDAGGWTNYSGDTDPVFNTVFDLQSLALNGGDTSVWAGSFGEGLLERKPGDLFTLYPSPPRVGGLTFDADGNGWVTSYGAGQELLLRRPDGSWHAFSIPFSHTDNAVAGVLVDDNKQVWIISPKGNGVFCYSPGISLDDTGDDQWKFYRAGASQGNLPDNNVYCIARDKSGFIWIGTANGIGLVQCPRNIFTAGGCEVIWPVVQFDGFAGYLFSGQPVQTIAVDGADRKWVGSRNGAWLISPDAQKIIEHFTEDNSPLLSNDVKKIAVDPQSGEVFFLTARGICSFRGTATEGGRQNSNVLVFPNPVPPGYNGTIAIRGLVDGAIVKITQLDGRLVYQAGALGGQVVWNGRDYKGRPAATGVYLVLASNESRQEKIVTKIVFIGK